MYVFTVYHIYLSCDMEFYQLIKISIYYRNIMTLLVGLTNAQMT